MRTAATGLPGGSPASLLPRKLALSLQTAQRTSLCSWQGWGEMGNVKSQAASVCLAGSERLQRFTARDRRMTLLVQECSLDQPHLAAEKRIARPFHLLPCRLLTVPGETSTALVSCERQGASFSCPSGEDGLHAADRPLRLPRPSLENQLKGQKEREGEHTNPWNPVC